MVHVLTCALVALAAWATTVLTGNFGFVVWWNLLAALLTIGICGYTLLLFMAPWGARTKASGVMVAIGATIGLLLTAIAVYRTDPVEQTALPIETIVIIISLKLLLLGCSLKFLKRVEIPKDKFGFMNGVLWLSGIELRSTNPFSLNQLRVAPLEESDSVLLEGVACADGEFNVKVAFTRHISFARTPVVQEFHASDLEKYREETRNLLRSAFKEFAKGASLGEVVSGRRRLVPVWEHMNRYSNIRFTCKVTKVEWMLEHDSTWKAKESAPESQNKYVGIKPTSLAH